LSAFQPKPVSAGDTEDIGGSNNLSFEEELFASTEVFYYGQIIGLLTQIPLQLLYLFFRPQGSHFRSSMQQRF